MNGPLFDELQSNIKTLNNAVWERRVPWPKVDEWLHNFVDGLSPGGHEERLHALYLLARFIYFGDREIRELLRALYRDVFKYPIVESVRRKHGDTTNTDLLSALYRTELNNTRFLGIGNPSESGTHLLYYFRQENQLSKDLFINAHEIFSKRSRRPRSLRNGAIKRYVFLDDLCASGQQAQEYSEEFVEDIRALATDAEVLYYTLIATTEAKETILNTTRFTNAECVMELDPSFRVFARQSRYFGRPEPELSKAFAEQICRRYGAILNPSHPLGYRDCQLLVGFHHNIPDNTLPIIWSDREDVPWTPIFRRYPKV